MRRWSTVNAVGRWLFGVLFFLSLPGATWFSQWALGAFASPPEQWNVTYHGLWMLLGGIVCGALAGGFLYRFVSDVTLHYELDRNALSIGWLGNRWIIPMNTISGLTIGDPEDMVRRGWTGFVGLRRIGRTPDGRPVWSFSVRPVRNSVLVHTSSAVYALSPTDEQAFLKDVEQRRAIGVVQSLAEGPEYGRLFNYPFWIDPFVRIALAGVGLILSSMGVIIVQYYAALPAVLDAHFDAAGGASGVEPRHVILFLPLAAVLIACINIVLGTLIYKREQRGARLLQFASLTVTILFALAALRILLQTPPTI